jgi:signal transduction histidine kinase
MPARATSLRRRLNILLALLILVSFSSSLMLVFLTREIRVHADELAKVLRDAQRIQALRIQLVWFERTRNLALIRGQATPFDDAATRELREALLRVERGFAPAGASEYNEVAELVRRYLSTRLAAEQESRDLAKVEDRVVPTFNAALEACDRVIARDDARASDARAAAYRWDAFTDVAGATCAVLLALFVVAWIVVTRRSVFQPLFRLREAILRFGRGDLSVRLPLDAPRELRDVASTFNEMSERIEHERERRLSFLAGVAHDMNNPLMALRMSSALARRGEHQTEERWRAMFERVDRQVLRLSRMVEDLLDASRIEAGRLELRRERVDLRELIQEAAELHSPLPPSHRLELVVPETPVPIYADDTRIAQVLNNLLSNAIKYSPRGGEIRLSLEVRDGCAVLGVRDQGIGIAPDELDKVFEPFRRASSVEEGIPGVGLGLSVVRRIVTAHGGEIAAESEPGRGTTFRVRLPLAEV